MEDIGRVTKISRVWIFQTIELTDEYVVQDHLFEWTEPGLKPLLGMPSFSMFKNSLEVPAYRQLIESRARGEWQKVIPSTLSDSWLRHLLYDEQHVRSMLTVPIMVEGRWWGTLGVDDNVREYDFSEPEIALLSTAGNLIAGAFLQSRLTAQIRQLELMRKDSDVSTWAMDIKKSRLWVSGSVFGAKREGSGDLFFKPRGALRLLHPDDLKGMLASLQRYFSRGKGTFRRDVRVRATDGSYRWVEVVATLGRDAVGRPEQFAGIAVDIRRRKQAERRLRRQASTDPLTGVSNRRGYEETLAYRFAGAVTTGEDLSLLTLDLDHFKSVNDTWGHMVGDEVLRHFAQICRQSLRDGDILARIGGEEFAVILPGAGPEEARAVGERIRSTVEATAAHTEQGRVQCTVSIGAATLSQGAYKAVDDIVCASDQALYLAKRSGRNLLLCAPQVDSDPG